jgi:hypothetical protein
MCSVVEDNTVLENLSYRSALMRISSLKDLNGVLAVSCYGTSKEVTTSAETKLCWAEWILYCAVRRRLADKATWRGWRVLTLCKTVDAVVEKDHVEVDVTTVSVDEVVTTDSKSVTIT